MPVRETAPGQGDDIRKLHRVLSRSDSDKTKLWFELLKRVSQEPRTDRRPTNFQVWGTVTDADIERLDYRLVIGVPA